MTPDRFRECLEILGASQRGLAAVLKYDERQVRRWAAGATIPDDVAAWLEKMTEFHKTVIAFEEQNPPPVPRKQEREGC